MNKRIRKKKEKQQREQMERLVAALIEAADAMEAAEREYWRRWAEERTRQFVEHVFRHCEQRYGRKEGDQLTM